MQHIIQYKTTAIDALNADVEFPMNGKKVNFVHCMLQVFLISGGSGKLKDDNDYEAESSDEDTELEESTTQVQRKTSSSKKRKKTTWDPSAKKWKDRATRAEWQLKNIANTRVINAFQEGEVRQYSKQVMWKKVKFTTCNGTRMVQCMLAFEVMEAEQEN
jgi:hypothetical protein